MRLLQLILDKIKLVYQNITIEPAMFVYYLFFEITYIPLDQLKIEKSCRTDFNYTEEICSNLLDGNHDDENTAVQNEASTCSWWISSILITSIKKIPQIAQFNVYMQIMNSAIPIIMCFYIGSWCDVIGRKFVMFICILARIASVGFQLLCVIFMDWPKEWLLVSTFLNSLSGKSQWSTHAVFTNWHYGTLVPEKAVMQWLNSLILVFCFTIQVEITPWQCAHMLSWQILHLLNTEQCGWVWSIWQSLSPYQ